MTDSRPHDVRVAQALQVQRLCEEGLLHGPGAADVHLLGSNYLSIVHHFEDVGAAGE